jgi:serralysin
MSGSSTVNGANVGPNPSNASGAGSAFQQSFNSAVTATVISQPGSVAVSGSVDITSTQGTLTVSGASAIADTSTGNNVIYAQNSNAAVFAAGQDTISAWSGATTVFGASVGQTTVVTEGSGASVTGGSGSIKALASGGNSTLVGGTGVSLFTVQGNNNLAVAGTAGTTGVDLSSTSGPETVATNPLGNSGTLVAFLGSGADSVIGGSGASTVQGGSGQDSFIFVKGHAGGSETILGFSDFDNIGFAGYGYNGANLPTETVGSLGDVITLNDGTNITLVGVFHKLF